MHLIVIAVDCATSYHSRGKWPALTFLLVCLTIIGVAAVYWVCIPMGMGVAYS
jgi:hypothetical protein